MGGKGAGGGLDQSQRDLIDQLTNIGQSTFRAQEPVRSQIGATLARNLAFDPFNFQSQQLPQFPAFDPFGLGGGQSPGFPGPGNQGLQPGPVGPPGGGPIGPPGGGGDVLHPLPVPIDFGPPPPPPPGEGPPPGAPPQFQFSPLPAPAPAPIPLPAPVGGPQPGPVGPPGGGGFLGGGSLPEPPPVPPFDMSLLPPLPAPNFPQSSGVGLSVIRPGNTGGTSGVPQQKFLPSSSNSGAHLAVQPPQGANDTVFIPDARNNLPGNGNPPPPPPGGELPAQDGNGNILPPPIGGGNNDTVFIPDARNQPGLGGPPPGPPPPPPGSLPATPVPPPPPGGNPQPPGFGIGRAINFPPIQGLGSPFVPSLPDPNAVISTLPFNRGFGLDPLSQGTQQQALANLGQFGGAVAPDIFGTPGGQQALANLGQFGGRTAQDILSGPGNSVADFILSRVNENAAARGAFGGSANRGNIVRGLGGLGLQAEQIAQRQRDQALRNVGDFGRLGLQGGGLALAQRGQALRGAQGVGRQLFSNQAELARTLAGLQGQGFGQAQQIQEQNINNFLRALTAQESVNLNRQQAALAPLNTGLQFLGLGNGAPALGQGLQGLQAIANQRLTGQGNILGPLVALGRAGAGLLLGA